MQWIPNGLTLLNLASGSVAVVLALEGDTGIAALFILLAALFDFCDGFAARLLKAGSALGKELDSLADMVSFGVAPGMIAFVLMKRALPGMNLPLGDIPASGWSWFFLASSLLIPLFSAVRLARFNLDERQTHHFLGMPTPANAILWASFGMIAASDSRPEVLPLLFTSGNLLVAILITSLLLVSDLPMFSLKFHGFRFRENWYRYVFLVVSVALLVLSGLFGLSVVILLYCALSVSFYLFKVPL